MSEFLDAPSASSGPGVVVVAARLRVESAADRSYRLLKMAILSGEIPQGELLSENLLAESFGVSRTPVRQAIVRLEAESYVRVIPKRGAMVHQINLGEIEELMEARAMVERFAVELVLDLDRGVGPTASQLDELSASIDRQEKLAEDKDVAAFVLEDSNFHSLMVDMAGNRFLGLQYRALRERQLFLGVTAIRLDPNRVSTILFEHRSIVEALSEPDRQKTLRQIGIHIESTRRIYAKTKGGFDS